MKAILVVAGHAQASVLAHVLQDVQALVKMVVLHPVVKVALDVVHPALPHVAAVAQQLVEPVVLKIVMVAAQALVVLIVQQLAEAVVHKHVAHHAKVIVIVDVQLLVQVAVLIVAVLLVLLVVADAKENAGDALEAVVADVAPTVQEVARTLVQHAELLVLALVEQARVDVGLAVLVAVQVAPIVLAFAEQDALVGVMVFAQPLVLEAALGVLDALVLV